MLFRQQDHTDKLGRRIIMGTERNSGNQGADLLFSQMSCERELIRHEMESQRFFIRSVLSLGSFLVVGLSAAAVYLVGSSLSELKNEVLQLANTRVEAAITDEARNVSEISALARNLSKAQEDYLTYSNAIQALSGLAGLEGLGARDPYGTYEKLTVLHEKYEGSGEPLTDEERATAVQLLEYALEAAQQGLTEPNTVFNTAVAASRLNFSGEAVRLAVLAAYWQPSLSHLILKSEYESLYGIAYAFDGSELERLDKSAEQVRDEAWENLKAIIVTAPRQESEQAYSRFSNVAVRNRSAGYYDEAILSIEQSADTPDNKLTSYAMATLANLYVFRGDEETWEDDYWRAVESAISLLVDESPGSSWYEHSVRELLGQAFQIDRLDQLIGLGDLHGVPQSTWEAGISSIVSQL